LDARRTRFHADDEAGIFPDIGNFQREFNLAQDFRIEDSHLCSRFCTSCFSRVWISASVSHWFFPMAAILPVLIINQVIKSSRAQLGAIRRVWHQLIVVQGVSGYIT